MLDALSFPFMQRALVAGLLVGLLASYFGAFIVQRRLSFLGVGLGHAAFGGVALGLLLGVQPLWIAIPFTVVVSIGITWIAQHGYLSGDTSVGIFFAVSMALGIIFLSLRTQYSADAFTYLFGSILSINRVDLAAVISVAALTLLSLPLWGRWTYATFDRDLAQADRVPVDLLDYLLNLLVALVVVTAVKVVGVVLVAAFLTIPVAAARIVSDTFLRMSLLAAAQSVISVLAGLAFSYQANLPSGASIVLVQATLFVLTLGFARLRRSKIPI